MLKGLADCGCVLSTGAHFGRKPRTRSCTRPFVWWRGLCLLLPVLLPWLAQAKPRTPLPPAPEPGVLYSQRFDQLLTNKQDRIQVKALQAGPLVLQNADLVESFSGYALEMNGNKTAFCFLPAGTGKKANFSLAQGSLRFWLAPGWSSSGNGNGKGPGSLARLVEVAEVAPSPRAGWSLYVDAQGTTLYLTVFAGGDASDLIKVPINWAAGEFRQVGVSWTGDSTALFINGKLEAKGPPMGPLDKLVALDKFGLFLGSDSQGQNLAQAQFEEIFIFGTACPEGQMAWNYQTLAPWAALGPVTPQEDQAQEQRILNASRLLSLQPLQRSGGAVMQMRLIPPGDTNLYLADPVLTNDTNVLITLLNADTNKSYDLYFVPVLHLSNNVFSLMVGQGSQGQTNFTAPMTNLAGFYRAYEGPDWDHDGVLNWQDAQPYSTNVGLLTITIDTPLNGTNFN